MLMIKPVKNGGQFLQVGRHPVRLEMFGRFGNRLWEFEKLLDERQLLFLLQARERRLPGHLNPFFPRVANDVASPGVGVLHIVNRVLVRSLSGQIQVEIEGTLSATGDKKEPRHVHAHLGKQLLHLDGATGAFRHLDRLAILQQVDLLHDQHLETILRITQSHERRLHAGDVAVVIRPPQIVQLDKIAVVFVDVIGDIDEKVGRLAFFGHQDPILFIAELRRAEPFGPVLLINKPLLFERGQDFQMPVARAQIFLAEPGVEMNPIRFERGPLRIEHLFQCHMG